MCTGPSPMPRWWRCVLAFVAATLVTLLGAGTASAATLAVAETRVGAATPATVHVVGAHESISAGQRWGHAPPQAVSVVGCGVAAEGATVAERLFTSRAVGVDSRLLGNSYARGESGLLNQTGSRVKFGWTSSGEFGGGWHLRLGVGRSSVNPNQARFHWDFGSTHVPNDMANDLLPVIRELNGLG